MLVADYGQRRNFGKMRVEIDNENHQACMFVQVGIYDEDSYRSLATLITFVRKNKRIPRCKVNMGKYGDEETLIDVCRILSFYEVNTEIFLKDDLRITTTARTVFFKLDMQYFGDWILDDLKFTSEGHYDRKLLLITDGREDIEKINILLKVLGLHSHSNHKIFLTPRTPGNSKTEGIKKLALKSGYGFIKDYKGFYFKGNSPKTWNQF